MFEKKSQSEPQVLWIGLSFLVLGLMIGLFVTGKGYQTMMGQQAGQQGAQLSDEELAAQIDPAQLPQVEVSVDDDAILGSAAAPITIVEFSDYQCPFCSKFHDETMPRLMADYINKGLVRFIYRDYPLFSKHPQAEGAAVAAECVKKYAKTNKDEAYFKMHNWLFENQASWSGDANANDQFVSAAKEIGVDIGACLKGKETLVEVEADYTAGKGYGVQSTPVFFINGKELTGAFPYAVFDKVLKSLTQKAE